MAEVTVETGPLRGQSLILAEDEAFVVGASADCTLTVAGPGVADQHLVIKALKNGGFGVKKLEASFLLNGQSSEAARLKDGDVLEVGSHRIRFGPPKLKSQAAPDITIEGYAVRKVLGKGGHGIVYRAEQLSLHREIALKVLKKDMTKNPEFVGRFVAEARAAARLSHPNVVQVFDVGHDGDTYYLSMEIMERGSLEDQLTQRGRIPVEECLDAMIDAAKGLAYAESMRIVHRDIKPDNIMVDSHGVAKIADLGLALSDDQEQGKIVGTPHFMSPEQARNKPLDHRSDLYSLGCTFFRLVTGRTLFAVKGTKEILTAHVKTEPDSADEVHEEVPRAVAEIIDRLVEKDPDDRYQSAEELIEDLESVLHPASKKGPIIAVIVLLVLAAGYGIYAAFTKPEGNGKTKIVKVKDEKALEDLRRAKADNEFLRIKGANLAPLVMAKQLEDFAGHDDYKGTPAATQAVAHAKKLRDAEAKRVAAEKQRDAAIVAAADGLKTKLEGLIKAGKYREAATALKPTDIPADQLRDPRVQAVLTAQRQAMVDKAGKQLAALQAAVDKARTAKDPDAMESALAELSKVLDRDTGWPARAFADRSAAVTFASEARKTIRQMRAELLSSAEGEAWNKFIANTLGADGVLARHAKFDTAGAVTLATQTATDAAKFKAAKRAADVLALVTAAKTYEDAYKKAIAAGTVKVPFSVSGAMLPVKVTGFDPKTGIAVAVPGAAAQTIPLTELTGARLLEVFPKLSDTTEPGRLAFLALHAIHEHLTAAAAYMAKIDPAATNGGPARYGADISTLTRLSRAITGLSTPWKDTLQVEVRAARELSRGLRAFGGQQYTSAQNHLENLQTRYGKSLAVLKVR